MQRSASHDALLIGRFSGIGLATATCLLERTVPTAKAGLHARIQHLAMDLADREVRVNAVFPAVVKTPIYQAFIEPSTIDETVAGLKTWPQSSASCSAMRPAGCPVARWGVDGGVMVGRN